MSDTENVHEESIENNEETTEEEVVETDADKLVRLTAENAELSQKFDTVNNEKSQMGRRVKELQDYQKTNDATVQSLQNAFNDMNKPKEEDGEFVDLTNPVIAKKWFQEQASELMRNQDNAQSQYEQAYEKNVNDLMNENESLSAEEKQSIMKKLESQKDNMFNDALRDAQYNINIAKGQHYEDIARGGTVTNKHIKEEKPVGTGVGGTGTKTQSAKKPTLTPGEQKIKDQFAADKAQRGW